MIVTLTFYWCQTLFEYLDELELLKKPSEQERLLEQSPKVIQQMVECKTSPQMFQKRYRPI